MSAYMVDRNHIRYLVEAARSNSLSRSPLYWHHRGVSHLLETQGGERIVCRHAAGVGQILWDENRKSIECRNPDTQEDFSHAPGPVGESFVYDRHEPAYHHHFNPVQVLKACACYEYQACEHSGWADSEAHAFIMALTHRAINCLQGYSEAEWGAPELR